MPLELMKASSSIQLQNNFGEVGRNMSSLMSCVTPLIDPDNPSKMMDERTYPCLHHDELW